MVSDQATATQVGQTPMTLALFDDNPATIDVLGFDAVVGPVLTALRQPDLDPITIGVHAPWGAGKSTLLGLIYAAAEHEPWVLVRVNPWEFDDQLDVKGTLIATVLEELEGRLGDDEKLKKKLKGLFRRISWSRVGLAVAKGALTMQWDPEKLVDAFNPHEEEGPRSLAQFRAEFDVLLGDIKDVHRVVVLVDDLDRCMPPAVIATLEAIKLFLSVRKMVFVIAADQEMVENAIAAEIGTSRRGDFFARHYLEKIVQLPISLPQLSPADTEAYIGLLLSRAANPDGFVALADHCAQRRRDSKFPFLADFTGMASAPSAELLRLAAQLAAGLEPSKRGNPREIKRFLNAFAIRSQIAAGRALDVPSPVLAKLLLLEVRFRDDFKRLLAVDAADRGAFLAAWEAWGRGADAAPKGVGPETRDWAGSEPSLASQDLDAYLTLAATLVAASTATGLSDELREVVRDLLGSEQLRANQALETLAKRRPEEQRRVVEALFDETRRADDVEPIIETLIKVGNAIPLVVDDIADRLRNALWARLGAGNAYDLGASKHERFKALARDLVAEEATPESVRRGAQTALEQE
jgi:KAP family P-loop domain